MQAAVKRIRRSAVTGEDDRAEAQHRVQSRDRPTGLDIVGDAAFVIVEGPRGGLSVHWRRYCDTPVRRAGFTQPSERGRLDVARLHGPRDGGNGVRELEPDFQWPLVAKRQHYLDCVVAVEPHREMSHCRPWHSTATQGVTGGQAPLMGQYTGVVSPSRIRARILESGNRPRCQSATMEHGSDVADGTDYTRLRQ